MRHEPEHILAVDIGGTQFRIALVSTSGKILKRHAVPNEFVDNPSAGLHYIKTAVTELIAGESNAGIAGMGVAIAGLVTVESGVLLTSPNLLKWYGTPIKEIFERELGLPVWVCNDANLAALGEQRYGVGKGIDDLIFITVSTGIGGGIIINGKMFLGSQGFGAEIGHMTIDNDGPRCNCGNIGCLEMLASGTAIARMARERMMNGEASTIKDVAGDNLTKITAETVFAKAKRGDGLAISVVNAATRNLGIGIVNLVHLFNPQMIVLGGGVSQAGDMLLVPVRQVVAERIMKDIEVNIVLAALNADSGLLGAVAMVLDNVKAYYP